MPEAATVATDAGLVPAGEGWFVLNLLAAAWERKGEFGVRCRVEARDARFPRFGIAIHVLGPGQPNALYHAEETQEGFLVLAGECRAIVEGRERELRQWDYLHCPPNTPHVIVGAGEEPCVILMVGAPRTASLDKTTAVSKSFPERRPKLLIACQPKSESACFQGKRASPLPDSNRRPPPYHGGSGAVLADTTGHPRPRSSCKSALPTVSMMPARDRACSTCCTRLVPAHCRLFSKHTTEKWMRLITTHEPLRVQVLTRSTAFRSVVDDGHARLLVALANGRSEVVQPCDLLDVQLDTVGCSVLLDAGNPLRAGDRGDIVALREQPGESDLCWCGVDLGSDRLDLVDDAKVFLEVAFGEARVVLAPVAVVELVRGAERSGEEAVPERRVGHEADAQVAQQR